MKQNMILYCGILAIILAGCAYSWQYQRLEEFETEASAPAALECHVCHQKEYDTWEHSKHGDATRMEKISVRELRECAACHSGLTAHVEEPVQNIPTSFAELSQIEQNTACGKCHYNHDLFGSKAINPHNRHGLFMSVGFEEKKQQISCLDCHIGHGEKSKLLRRVRAHTCYTCHKEAIVTMGVFQPLNYLAAGKVCFSCHPPHGGSTARQAAGMGAVIGASCVACHPTGL